MSAMPSVMLKANRLLISLVRLGQISSVNCKFPLYDEFRRWIRLILELESIAQFTVPR